LSFGLPTAGTTAFPHGASPTVYLSIPPVGDNFFVFEIGSINQK